MMLLRHPVPYNYESLSNYIIRLSKENLCDISWLNGVFKIKSNVLTTDVYNISITTESMQMIASATGLSFDIIKSLTINRFNLWDCNCNYVYESKELIHFISEKSNKFCPLCLKANNYERIFWKLKHINVCLEHKILLINRCSTCGHEINFYNLVNKNCTCGTKLEDMNPTHVNDEEIINNQKRIYEIFNLERSTNKNISSTFDSINVGTYAKLINRLYEISIEHTDFLKLQALFQVSDNCPNQLSYMLITEKIIDNWPYSFYEFIDLLNKFYYNSLDFSINRLKSSYLSPLVYSSGFFIDFDLTNKCTPTKELFYYFYLRYNYEFFSKVLNPVLVRNKFIETHYIEIIFGMPIPFINKHFTIYELENASYVKLSDIISFFRKFIKKDNIAYIRNRVSITNIQEMFNGLDVDLDDVYNIALNYEESININPLENGMNMLELTETQIKIDILEFLINKLKE